MGVQVLFGVKSALSQHKMTRLHSSEVISFGGIQYFQRGFLSECIRTVTGLRVEQTYNFVWDVLSTF